MKKIISACLLLCAGLLPAACSGGGEPGFPKIKGWKLQVSPEVYVPENLWDLIDGAAESYLSYDFVDLHLADYKNKDGTVVHTEIYRHSNADNAFGIYSSERSEEYDFLDIGIQGYQEEGVLNFFSGQYYLKLYSTAAGDGLPEFLRQIAGAIDRHLDQVNRWPPTLKVFPQSGKLENREHYIRENFLGLNFLSNAFTAEYRGGYKLFVIRGGSEDEILKMVTAYLDFTGQAIDPGQERSFLIKDRYNGDIQAVLKGPYLAGLIQPESVGQEARGMYREEAMENLETLVSNLPE